jgi:hypothetical protein
VALSFRSTALPWCLGATEQILVIIFVCIYDYIYIYTHIHICICSFFKYNFDIISLAYFDRDLVSQLYLEQTLQLYDFVPPSIRCFLLENGGATWSNHKNCEGNISV